ncbi:MAG: VWA domain-containing protein, partial [Sphingomonas taxi]
ERAGFVPLRAVLGGNAARSVATVVAVQDPARILYLGERQQGASSRLRALLGPGFAVDAPAPAAVGEGFDFGAYRAVLLDDLPATRLPAVVQRRLLDQVAGVGTGLFYSGGTQAFGTGGYAGTPLADALPVTLRQDQKLEQPSVALALVIDTSGSMVGPPLDLAKQVARFAVRRLTPIDSVGVVEFYGAKQWAVPFQPARDVPAVERAIARMQAQGSSILFPAIQEAYFALRNTNARYRHILVVTDAGVEEQRYQSLLTQISRDRIALSTALVGPDAQGEERMAQWARWGGGRYYAVPDEFSLVELNLTQPQDKPSPGYRRGSFALTPPSGRARWQGVAMTQVPPVAGYVPVGRRAAAETLLSTAGGDPMLATWPYGNGRITALMTEPLGEGTRGWAGWRGYGRWLAGILARTADPQADADLSVERRFDRVTVTLRGTPRADGAMPQVRLVAPDGRADATVTMEERAPGWFVGTRSFPSDRAALVEARWGGRTIRAADRAGSDVSPVDVIPTANRLPLDALAQATGGVHAAGPDAPFAPPHPRGRELTATALWPWLALAALALYLLDILYRRWPGRRRPTGRPAR